MPDRPTIASVKATTDQHKIRLDGLQLADEKHHAEIQTIRREYEAEIRVLKEQVAELKADKKAREAHESKINVLSEQVGELKDKGKTWEGRFWALAAGVVVALIGAFAKK